MRFLRCDSPLVASLVAAVALAGCKGGEATGTGHTPLDPAAAPIPLTAMAFPNGAWQATTTPGARVPGLVVPELARFRNFLGQSIDWDEELVRRDGFSPFQPVLVPTREGCPALPGPGQESWSLAETAPVHLIDRETERRLPYLGEPGPDSRVCELYPLAPWTGGGSAEVDVTEFFAATLPAAVDRNWTFPVGTFRNRVDPGYAIRDAALAWARQADDLLVERRDAPEGPDAAAIAWKGRYRVPWFLGPDGRIRWTDDGRPIQQGTATDQFFAIAATTATAATGALPVVQYGHGLFGDPREVFYTSQRELLRRNGGLFGAVAWGMAVRYFHRTIAALVEPSRLGLLQDVVLQSMVHQVLFAQVLRDELGPKAAAVLARPATTAVDYVGISQGGILGSMLAALSPDLRRMVLHVGGGGWTAMMTHSSNWTTADGFGYGDAVAGAIPDARARTLLLAAWQPIWDVWDPAVFAPYWLAAPPGVVPGPPADRRVYYPYAIADPQVPNFSSETVLRAAGAPLLQPAVRTPPRLEVAGFGDGPFEVVGAQWDVGPGPPAHADVRCLPAFARQVERFLAAGDLIDACDGGSCTFAPNPPACSRP